MPSDENALDKFITTETIPSVADIGDLRLRPIRSGIFFNLANADASGSLADAELVSRLIVGVTAKEQKATIEAHVGSLPPADRARIVEKIIAMHPEWFDDDQEEDDKVEGIARDADESDEAYLARGFRHRASGYRSVLSRLVSPMRLHSERMQSLLKPSLVNAMASKQVGSVLNSMGGLKEPSEFDAKIPEIDFKILRSPVLDTNDILREVASQIGQMRDLAAATADMQRSLNDTARTAVMDFSAGAENAEKATQTSLKVAKISLAISAIALVVSLVVPWFQSADTDARDKAEAARTEQLIAAEATLAKRLSDLRLELERGRLREQAEDRALRRQMSRLETELARQSVAEKGT